VGAIDPVAAYLRERREELGKSRQQIVQRTRNKVSHSHLSKLETGDRRATADVLQLLAPALDVEVAYLLKLAGFLPAGSPAKEPTPRPIDDTPRDPRALVKWLRGDPTITEDDAKLIAQNYEHIRRMREQGGAAER
jgi:transcriptional regulator with XRE-family HTH domain